MVKKQLKWMLGLSENEHSAPEEMMPATVPGAAQRDYAEYNKLPDIFYGTNYENLYKLEDVFWHYRTELKLDDISNKRVFLCFDGIDYKYVIKVNGDELLRDEGMFSPVKLDISKYIGKTVTAEVVIFPCPKVGNSFSRAESRYSCKAAACYGWDWHPRLLTAGLWGDAYLMIEDNFCIVDFDVSYRLSDNFDSADITLSASTTESGNVVFEVLSDGKTVASETVFSDKTAKTCITLQNPELWSPHEYGSQKTYKVAVSAGDSRIERNLGFRRVELVMNEGSWYRPKGFPMSRSDAPATLKINGRKIFAKGSNFVNAKVFPGEMTEEHYEKLLQMVKEANMNILRIWGGGFVNKESFYDLCDKLGIMVWQEFPLSCNEYPNDDGYLGVLEKEATAIVKRLRTHPSVVLWCGGNELFNSWSKMTDQHHALRLLDKVTYSEDRFTPFIMTSPLNGMGHGNYLNYDDRENCETIQQIMNSNLTAYTEFGCPGMASGEYIRKFMSEEDFNDVSPENKVWIGHHGFGAWRPNSWVRICEVEYFFGGYTDTDDLCEKTQFIQSMCYRSAFEEMRRQWPQCSMALNWCLNEPWPTAANNSIISYPDIKKPAFESVKTALRPFAATLRIPKQLWWEGEKFKADIHILNDSITEKESGKVKIYYSFDGEKILAGEFAYGKIPEQTNVECGSVSFVIPENFSGFISVFLEVEGHPEASSVYKYPCKSREKVIVTVPRLNE